MESLKYATRNAIAADAPPPATQCQFCGTTVAVRVYDSLSGEKLNTFMRRMAAEAKAAGRVAPRKFAGIYAKTLFLPEDAAYAAAAVAYYRANVRIFAVCAGSKCIREMNIIDSIP